MSEGPPPQDLRAERALIGALLLAPRRVRQLIGTPISASDFYLGRHAVLFELIEDWLNTHPGDPDPQAGIAVQVLGELESRGRLHEVGGQTEVLNLLNDCPSTTGARVYARRITEAARRRDLLGALHETAQDAYRGDQELVALLASAKERVDRVSARCDFGHQLRSPEDSVSAYLDLKERRQFGLVGGIRTQLANLDQLTGGMSVGDTWLLGGRTNQGKTSLAIALAIAAARQQQPVLFISLEMTEEQLVERILSSLSGVNTSRLRDASPDSPLSEHEERKLAEATKEYLELGIMIHDDPLTTVEHIGEIARVAGIGGGRGLVIVDYLQLLEGNLRTGNRQEQVAANSRAIKILARDLETTFLLLVQLLEGDTLSDANPIPQLRDIRESRAPAQDASVVLLLHRPNLLEEGADNGDFDLYLRKNRYGPRDRRIRLIFSPRHMRFHAPGETNSRSHLRPVPDGVHDPGEPRRPGGQGNSAADALRAKWGAPT